MHISQWTRPNIQTNLPGAPSDAPSSSFPNCTVPFTLYKLLVSTQAADKRATLGAQGNSPPGLGTDEGRGELGTSQLNHPKASATTQVPFRARRSQTGQSWEVPGATRRQLFAYFFWKKYDPFLVGTSFGGPPQSPRRQPKARAKKEPHASACKTPCCQT